jgi:NADH-quinone oxidoreductase subunit E
MGGDEGINKRKWIVAGSETLKAQIDAVASRYPKRRSAIMPALRLAQEEYGFLSREVMQEVAELLQMAPVKVYEIASFYSLLHLNPVGKHHLQLCTNIACMLRGAEELLAHLEKGLKVKPGETTADGRFTLSTVECLGACDAAPVMQVNDCYCERLTEKRIDDLLNALGQGRDPPSAADQ